MAITIDGVHQLQIKAENGDFYLNLADETARNQIEDLTQDVETNTSNITLQTARIDNLLVQGTPTEGNAELIDIRVGADGTTYDSAGDAVRKQVSDVNDDMNKTINVLSEAIDYKQQMLRDSDRVNGKHYWLSGGKVLVGDGTNVAMFPPINVKANVTYFYKNLYAYFCFLDDGTPQRLSETTGNFQSGSFTPQADGKVYITINTGAQADNILTSGEYHSYVNENTDIFDLHLSADKYIHLKIALDGTGDYTDPISAVRDIKDSSETRQYMLDIYEGTYTLQDKISEAEKVGSFWGLTLPDYVHMRGIGELSKIVIDCSLPNDSSVEAVQYTSTLNVRANNNLENITFTGTNVRYVVHDESSNGIQNWKRIVKNCRFIHNGNQDGFWAYTGAWGEGCSSGSYSEFENCEFENHSYFAPYSFHTNTAFTSPCTHKFKNCRFVQNYFGTDSEGSFKIIDIQSRQAINVEFIGCEFSRFIFVTNNGSSEDIEEINLTGHGNNPVYVYSYRPNVSTPKRIFAKFADEVMLVYNPYSAIDVGRPLRWTSYNNNTVGIAQSNGTQCCGIALERIGENSLGYMQFSGIINLYDLGVSNISQGDLVGVTSWSLAKVTDGTHFARAIQAGVIKLC